MRTALITGVTGQDGSYLAEFLLEQGYRVVGMTRRSSTAANERIGHLDGRLQLVQGDLLDQASLVAALRETRPDEVYNLAAQSFVPTSWNQPTLTGEFTALGVTRMLEAVRLVDPSIRFYQASSSEIFGEPIESPQNEHTPLNPLTPYGVAKTYGHFITRSFRHRYGLHACAGILYNHESPRRPLDFVPQKVAHAAAAIKLGLEEEVLLGDLDARRDWGYAADYVQAMWLMLQADKPSDYVIATGELHSVRELVECAFAHVGLDWREYVQIDESLKRGRAELHDLVGDSTKAQSELDWHRSVDFKGLVQLLVDAELARLDGDSSGSSPPKTKAP